MWGGRDFSFRFRKPGEHRGGISNYLLLCRIGAGILAPGGGFTIIFTVKVGGASDGRLEMGKPHHRPKRKERDPRGQRNAKVARVVQCWGLCFKGNRYFAGVGELFMQHTPVAKGGFEWPGGEDSGLEGGVPSIKSLKERMSKKGPKKKGEKRLSSKSEGTLTFERKCRLETRGRKGGSVVQRGEPGEANRLILRGKPKGLGSDSAMCEPNGGR